MTSKTPISTDQAPAAIGTYSQAVRTGNTVYISGQIPLVPSTMELVSEAADEQIRQVFDNLTAISIASGGSLDQLVKLNIYLTDLSLFPQVNEMMSARFTEPYPARAVVEVSNLPRGVKIEIDAILSLSE